MSEWGCDHAADSFRRHMFACGFPSHHHLDRIVVSQSAQLHNRGVQIPKALFRASCRNRRVKFGHTRIRKGLHSKWAIRRRGGFKSALFPPSGVGRIPGAFPQFPISPILGNIVCQQKEFFYYLNVYFM